MACAIEDAGFELRDQIMWLYGSGFPKSLDVSKAIDKAAGAEREVVGIKSVGNGNGRGEGFRHAGDKTGVPVTAPATNDARTWEGWGTALKPAHEPICVARKPLAGTVAANVLEFGTGALHIDACRIPVADADYARNCSGDRGHAGTRGADQEGATNLHAGGGSASDGGRWPANVIHDGSDEVLQAFAQFGEKGAAAPVHRRNGDKFRTAYGKFAGNIDEAGSTFHGDTGTAARFFYCAKTTRTDRNEGCEHMQSKPLHWSSGDQNPGSFQSQGTDKTSPNNHPTVKPTDLMAYLCRLVTPPGGLVLDPFMGSGSTGKACTREGFRFIGIDMTADYVEIARARIAHEAAKVEAARAASASAETSQMDLFGT
jgi:site-specific DNA-methyltransferase (adenine-specific)